MNLQDALRQMKSPRDKKPCWLDGILQIQVGRACNRACANCTQGSQLAGKVEFMTPVQFDTAVRSLTGVDASGKQVHRCYPGVFGVFGGNPTLSPHFADYCRTLRGLVSWSQRGLWSNDLRGKGAVCRITFNPRHSNLNCHLDKAAAEEMRRDWPECSPYVKGDDQDSRHSPPFVSMKDVGVPEAEMWRLIGNCSVNQRWSALVGVFRGELRGFFCELAYSQAALHQHEPDYPDTGVSVIPGWWDKPMSAFEYQVRKHCPDCGIPMNGYGELACNPDGVEQVSRTHADIYKPKQKGRRVELVVLRDQLKEGRIAKATDYLQNGALK
jgi:hypothetical protein